MRPDVEGAEIVILTPLNTELVNASFLILLCEVASFFSLKGNFLCFSILREKCPTLYHVQFKYIL